MTWPILALVWAHWLADFVLQTDAQARGKSTSNARLTEHVIAYGIAMAPPAAWLFDASSRALFLLVNAALHWATDYVTSRITSRLWAAGKRHEFFVVIGFDQALHVTALVLTFWWLS